MNLNEFAKEIHENAVAHGWWDEERSFPEIVALCHSELSEALEEYRSGDKMHGRISCMHYYSGGGYVANSQTVCCQKPEGIAVEMADCLIRIHDWCGKEGIDIERIIREKHEYNKMRPYRHGGKKC